MNPLIEKSLFWYYLIHIPITIFIDSSCIIPQQYQLAITSKIVDFHVSTNHDILLSSPQTWFKIFVTFEVVFQLPLFFYFLYKYLSNRLDLSYYLWSIIYGFNAGFTTFVCLIWLILEYKTYDLSIGQVTNLCAIYSPYVIIPLIIIINSFKNIRSLKLKTD
ncbi:conserved hypothetical protein [Candida tropicalis MYA-3404]|uniref:Efficient mitochondria targeting-associated protein 19 n=1 Tax=Candida tropicalis (strain ATCC MYA-3404 / T1) TaxID=294747 RepID=C5MFN6_CANTT|nr:conserved hypothetical protein [Candida tropicalis MYA-3404]EER31149.1 conserved hypothetical protein [Candida tropicalis MYA-3404]KAG4404712.1 hypothetical protein JTP64_005726 [Candida tropicalis]